MHHHHHHHQNTSQTLLPKYKTSKNPVRKMRGESFGGRLFGQFCDSKAKRRLVLQGHFQQVDHIHNSTLPPALQTTINTQDSWFHPRTQRGSDPLDSSGFLFCFFFFFKYGSGTWPWREGICASKDGLGYGYRVQGSAGPGAQLPQSETRRNRFDWTGTKEGR